MKFIIASLAGLAMAQPAAWDPDMECWLGSSNISDMCPGAFCYWDWQCKYRDEYGGCDDWNACGRVPAPTCSDYGHDTDNPATYDPADYYFFEGEECWAADFQRCGDVNCPSAAQCIWSYPLAYVPDPDSITMRHNSPCADYRCTVNPMKA